MYEHNSSVVKKLMSVDIAAAWNTVVLDGKLGRTQCSVIAKKLYVRVHHMVVSCNVQL